MNMRFLNIFLFLLYLDFSLGAFVINTWRFPEAADAAWNNLVGSNNAVDALEAGCGYCEEHQCGFSVGFGGSPDESGETTLDSLIFDGKTMDAGAVGNLRRVKNAVSVAKHVLQHTSHTLMAGDQATAFAVSMGFQEENLTTDYSLGLWENWKNNNCQPNFWKNVEPDPTSSCGPYIPISENNVYYNLYRENYNIDVRVNHDTIGMVVIDFDSNIAAATSTNGLRYKIPGRVGDSPIPGAGAYADNSVGAACATGNGDVMMRFLPSFLAVEKMREGISAVQAAQIAVDRISAVYPDFSGAVIAVSVTGEYGAACNGMAEFPFSLRNATLAQAQMYTVNCSNAP